MIMLENQAAAFRAGLLDKPLPGWAQKKSLLAGAWRKGRDMAKKPYQIEDGEWYFKGCFIQKQPTGYVVFADDSTQTHIGVCGKMADARTLCVENQVKKPKLGLLSFL